MLHWFKKWVEVFVEYINIFVIMSLFPFDLGHFLPVPSPFWLHVFYSLLYMSTSSWINTVSSLSEPPIKLMPEKANEFKTATFFPLLVLLVRRYSSASLSKLWIFDKGFPVRAPDAMSSVCLAFSKKDNNTNRCAYITEIYPGLNTNINEQRDWKEQTCRGMTEASWNPS